MQSSLPHLARRSSTRHPLPSLRSSTHKTCKQSVGSPSSSPMCSRVHRTYRRSWEMVDTAPFFAVHLVTVDHQSEVFCLVPDANTVSIAVMMMTAGKERGGWELPCDSLFLLRCLFCSAAYPVFSHWLCKMPSHLARDGHSLRLRAWGLGLGVYLTRDGHSLRLRAWGLWFISHVMAIVIRLSSHCQCAARCKHVPFTPSIVCMQSLNHLSPRFRVSGLGRFSACRV